MANETTRPTEAELNELESLCERLSDSVDQIEYALIARPVPGLLLAAVAEGESRSDMDLRFLTMDELREEVAEAEKEAAELDEN